jgi:hypothetical protein
VHVGYPARRLRRSRPTAATRCGPWRTNVR